VKTNGEDLETRGRTKEVIVYSRRRKSPPPLEDIAQSSSPATELVDTVGESSQGNSTPVFDDLDMPIAIRKSIRTCTQYPIARFVSSGKLNNSFRAFTANLSRSSVPNDIQEALGVPEWKD
ncbi:hypothetical protein Pfo_022659, partial [Paulownia fortunei]